MDGWMDGWEEGRRKGKVRNQGGREGEGRGGEVKEKKGFRVRHSTTLQCIRPMDNVTYINSNNKNNNSVYGCCILGYRMPLTQDSYK
jgi:hypothetical protein